MAFSAQSFSVGQVLTSSVMNQMDTNIDEVRTQHKGSSAPADLAAGVLWLDDSATPWVWQMYDGAAWITVGKLDATDNLFMPGNGPVLVESQTASASSEIDFKTGFGSGILVHEFRLIGVRPATDNTSIIMQTSPDAGVSFDSGASDYSYHITNLEGGTSTYSAFNSGAAANIGLASSIGNASDESLSGQVFLWNAPSTALIKHVTVVLAATKASGQYATFFGGGRRTNANSGATNVVDATRFKAGSGNIAEGTFEHWAWGLL